MLNLYGRKFPESPWGSPIPIGYGDGDVNRFPDEDGDGDGDETRKLHKSPDKNEHDVFAEIEENQKSLDGNDADEAKMDNKQLIALLNAQNQLLANYGLSHQLGQAQSYLQAAPNSLLGSRSTSPGFGLPNTQQGQAAGNLSSQQQALLARTLYGSTNAPQSSLPGQETIIPQAFNTITLQDPANANWNMETVASSS
ncbi:hypothetical protein Tco_0290354 [Tanacetum coccineum]